MRPLFPLLLGLLILWCCASSSWAANSTPNPTVFLLLVDRLALSDLVTDEAEHLRSLAAYGAVGLANVRTSGDSLLGAGHLTLGAGERAITGAAAGLSLSTNAVYQGQVVAGLYQGLTGDRADGGIVNLGIAELRALSGQVSRQAIPGYLGQTLQAAGIPTAVYGNADTYRELRRYGVLVAMDSQGVVGDGEVGPDVLTKDPAFPFAVRSDYDALWQFVEGHVGKTGFVVVEFGDLARLEELRDLVSNTQMRHLRQLTLSRIDQWVARLMMATAQGGHQAWVIVAAPSPARHEADQGFMLAPVIVGSLPLPAGETPRGALLTSPTTRRAGIIANYDITPTVLALYGMEGSGLPGRPIARLANANPVQYLSGLYTNVTRIHGQRLPVIQPYFFVQLAAVLLTAVGVAGLLIPRRFVWRWKAVAQWVHLGLVAFPLTLLILPLLPAATTLIGVWITITLVSTGLVIVAWAFRRLGTTLPFAALCGLTALVIGLDIATGSRLMQGSHLGYDPVGGSRYYGIGNEYMGVLLGTVAIAAGGFVDFIQPQRRPQVLWGIGIVFAVTVALLASPAHGANVGGTISAVVGLGSVLTLLMKERLRLRDLVLIGGLMGIVVGAVAWYDASVSGSQTSHLGSTVQQVGSQGGDPLWQMFERKLAMNARLIRLTIWSRAFFVSLVASVVFAFYPPRLVAPLTRRFPRTGLAIRGSLVGAVVVLLANDSGIVAAATLMIPVISTLLYLLLDLVEREPHGARQ